jgi:hypothetical protein
MTQLQTQMQTQMLMQQLQSQQLQMQYIQMKMNELVQKMAAKDTDALAMALVDPRAEIRWAATQAIAQRRLPLQDALIERLTDPHPDVRQSARGALIQLSIAQSTKTATAQTTSRKPRGNTGVDFGPAPSASRSAQATAAKKWSEWWAKQADSRTARADR